MTTQTPSQTVGPFFHCGLIRSGQNVLTTDRTAGQKIRITGVVRDGQGDVVPDAMIEIWQADARGIYNHPVDPRHAEAEPDFPGWGRSATDEEGRFWFETIKPGEIDEGGESTSAPHINVRVFARGMLIHAVTRLYFEDESANQQDPLLNSIGERKRTLIATRTDGRDLPTYRFDIVLQGEDETVFFDA